MLTCYRSLLTHFTYWVTSFTMSPCSSSGPILTTRGPFFFFFFQQWRQKSWQMWKIPFFSPISWGEGWPWCKVPHLHHSQRWADLKLAIPSGEGINLHLRLDCASLHLKAHLVMFSKERSCPLEPGPQFLCLFHLKVNKENIRQWSNSPAAN